MTQFSLSQSVNHRKLHIQLNFFLTIMKLKAKKKKKKKQLAYLFII